MDSKLRCVFDMPDTEDEGPHAPDDPNAPDVFSPTVQVIFPPPRDRPTEVLR